MLRLQNNNQEPDNASQWTPSDVYLFYCQIFYRRDQKSKKDLTGNGGLTFGGVRAQPVVRSCRRVSANFPVHHLSRIFTIRWRRND